MLPRIDLHTHSNCSDGVLTPAGLVARAAARKVELLALTDHDTVAGCMEARRACADREIQFVAGIELTCEWRGRAIHVIGLNIDDEDAALRTHCAAVLDTRRLRIGEIAARLTRAGLPGESLAATALGSPSPTRAHLARALCAGGYAASTQRAFDLWLKRGRPGHVSSHWPALETVMRCLLDAGALAVLAHPHRYKVSGGVLRELLGSFKELGGVGIEVSLAGMGPNDADRAATLARRFDLAGSIGSDFHEPDVPWRPLGRFAKLPDRVAPITAHLKLATGRSWA